MKENRIIYVRTDDRQRTQTEKEKIYKGVKKIHEIYVKPED